MSTEAHNTADPTVIAVRGEAWVEVPPERARVNIVIEVDGAEKTDIERRASEARNVCIDAAQAGHDPANGPITDWAAGQLQVWSQRPWNADGVQLPLVFHSRSTLSATFSDLEAVGPWIDAATHDDAVAVAGIDWSITDSTRRELEEGCQRDAVRNAVSKASVYASSLGLGRVHPTEIAEPVVLGAPDAEFGGVSRMALASAPGTPTGFTPEPIRIHVAVNARFEARPAD